MIEAAGSGMFTVKFYNLYGMNGDQLPIWNSFLDGKLSVEQITKQLQDLTDAVRNDDSIEKIEIK